MTQRVLQRSLALARQYPLKTIRTVFVQYGGAPKLRRGTMQEQKKRDEQIAYFRLLFCFLRLAPSKYTADGPLSTYTDPTTLRSAQQGILFPMTMMIGI